MTWPSFTGMPKTHRAMQGVHPPLPFFQSRLLVLEGKMVELPIRFQGGLLVEPVTQSKA